MEEKSGSDALSWYGFVGVQSKAMKRLRNISVDTKSLTVSQPRMILLQGPSRCGKSTWAQAYARELGALYKHVDGKAIYSEVKAEKLTDSCDRLIQMIIGHESEKLKVFNIDNFLSLPTGIFDEPLILRIRSACETSNVILCAEYDTDSLTVGGTNWDEQLFVSFELSDGDPFDTNFEKLINFYIVQLQEKSSNPPIKLGGLDYQTAGSYLNSIEYKYVDTHPNAILKKALWDLLIDMAIEGRRELTQEDLINLVTKYYAKYNDNTNY